MEEYYRVRAEIHLDAIYRNIERTKDMIRKGTKIMAIIKADGYGHGAVAVAKTLDTIVDAFGVAVIEEAIELRQNGVTKPILLLGYTPWECFSEVVKYDVSQTVYHMEMAEALAKEAVKQGKTVSIHVKIDTGMTRLGFADNEENIEVIKEIVGMDGIRLDGCFTHFARADDQNLDFTKEQFRRYQEFTEKLEREGIEIPIRHVSNSAGILQMPEANLDMVRSGISTYGLYPSDNIDKSKLLLEPAMELKARISFVKDVEVGTPISYGGTYVTKQKSRIATVPVGYADGYPRALSSKGRVLIHGQYAPILGRICMDQFMIDVTDIPSVKEGDVVTLMGKDEGQYLSVEEISEMANSFHYEFVCNIGKRIPRLYHS